MSLPARLGVGLLSLVLLAGCASGGERPPHGTPIASPSAVSPTEPRHSPIARQPSPISQRLMPPQCAVTPPNGDTPEAGWTGVSHGNGVLWTGMWHGNIVYADPSFVRPDGSINMKWPWFRGVPGTLTVQGRRLDASAPALSAFIPNGYGDTGFQPSVLYFSAAGCWEVTGRVGDASLTFVTLVLKVDAPPTWPPPVAPR
jgi:hypothetical protein